MILSIAVFNAGSPELVCSPSGRGAPLGLFHEVGIQVCHLGGRLKKYSGSLKLESTSRTLRVRSKQEEEGSRAVNIPS